MKEIYRTTIPYNDGPGYAVGSHLVMSYDGTHYKVAWTFPQGYVGTYTRDELLLEYLAWVKDRRLLSATSREFIYHALSMYTEEEIALAVLESL